MKSNTHHDLIIVGGGIAGGILASLMAQNGFNVAIVEARISEPSKPDPRVFAITRASEMIFRRAGIWAKLAQQPLGHFREMHVWDANGAGSIHFDSKALSEPTLGYIIENQRIQNALREKLGQFTHLTWYCPANVESLNLRQNNAELLLDSGKRLTAKLIVGADGASSRIRQLAGISNHTHDYHQTAVVCSVKTQSAHHDIARQRFLSTGPLAFLPLADPHTCSIVWSTTTGQARVLLNCDEQEFNFQLEQAFDSTLGAVLETTQRFSFPLSRAHSSNYVAHRLALIGDAAHRVHPLAGQGANLGILDAATLAEVLNRTERDIGYFSTLRKYERWRKGENLAVIMAMDVFKYLFGSTIPPLQWSRNAGLNLTDSLTPVKRLIMRRAMGLTGDLPMLAHNPESL